MNFLTPDVSDMYIYIYIYMCVCVCGYVIVISWYEHDIQVIAQDRGEAEVVGNDLDIVQVNRDITNFFLTQIDFQLLDLIGNN